MAATLWRLVFVEGLWRRCGGGVEELWRIYGGFLEELWRSCEIKEIE